MDEDKNLVFRTELISLGPYLKTTVRIFCRMELTVVNKSILL